MSSELEGAAREVLGWGQKLGEGSFELEGEERMRNEKCGMRNELAGNAERGVFELGPSSPVCTQNSAKPLAKTQNPELRTQNL